MPTRSACTAAAFAVVTFSQLAITVAHAQASASVSPPSDAGTWDVTKARGRTRQIDFTTTEGTWTSVDISRDGAFIVFDLLSHVYRMPASGGTAISLTQSSGIASNFHPRISPDGKSIAFVSDRGGGDFNLWVMDANGANPHIVADAPRDRMFYPQWTADNLYIAVLQEGATDRSLVMYHRDGGTGVTLVKSEEGRAVHRHSISYDGRYLYYDVYTGRSTGYDGRSDALGGAVQLQQFDLQTGVGRALTSGTAAQQNRGSSGGAFAPEPSPDGRWLAFMRKVPGGTLEYRGQRFGPRSALWIRDLRLGGERLLMDPVEMDLSEASWPVDGSYPMYRWAADGLSIVLHQGGKIRRVDVATGAVSTIPFSARVQRTISEQAVTTRRISDGDVNVRYLRWASVSPNGRALAFQALGRIWVQTLPTGKPRRLTQAAFDPFEFQPAWSPDGQSIAFTTVDSLNRGALWRIAVTDGETGGAPERLTREAGEYMNPSWTPDGREIVVARGGGASARGSTIRRSGWFDVVRVAASGINATGAETDIDIAQTTRRGLRDVELRPTVGTDGRVYWAVSNSYGSGGAFAIDARGIELASIRFDGTDRRVHASIKDADDAAVSPSGQWVVFMQGGNVYLSPLPVNRTGATAPKIAKKNGELPVTTLSTLGGLFPRWRSDSVVDFGSANQVISYNVLSMRADTLTVQLSAPRSIATGSIALTNARIVTLDQKRVIPKGTIVVTNGRISCVGTCSTSGVSRVVNASGKTIIPGWVDVHAHHHGEFLGMMPRQNFESAIYLAYGVTTTSDPASTSSAMFPTAELIEAGEMVGPRVFSTAEAMYAGDAGLTNNVATRDDALSEITRRMSWGATMIKQYMQPTREQRQWIADAARERGVRITAEASDDLNYRLGMMMDGYTGGEHVQAQSPLYSDVTNFIARANYVYSHTPLLSGLGAWNEEWFWQESPVWLDPKQQQWLPWRMLIPHTRRVVQRPETDYSKDIMAQSIADIVSAGGSSAVGAHGQQHGLGSHWDVWMTAKATGNMTALEIASMHGARFLGIDADIGSITVGKLADLMVLNANPLENIRSTTNIRYVMKAGVLYDANSLDELWPKQRPYGDSPWYQPEMFRRDIKKVGTFDRP